MEENKEKDTKQAKVDEKEAKVAQKPENKKETKKEVKANKKLETKKKAKDGKKKSNSIIGAVVLGVILLVAIIILAVALTAKTPENAVNGMFNSLKTGDFEKVNEFVNYNELMNSSEISAEDGLDQETQKLFFDKLDWKIIKVEKENDNATIEVEVTNKDFKTILGNYMQKVLKVAFSGQEMSDQEIENYLIEELRNEQAQTTTVTKTIQAVKQDGEWKVVVDEELEDALLPGLNDAVNALS